MQPNLVPAVVQQPPIAPVYPAQPIFTPPNAGTVVVTLPSGQIMSLQITADQLNKPLQVSFADGSSVVVMAPPQFSNVTGPMPIVITTGRNNPTEPTFNEIYCECVAPRFQSCQQGAGFFTACLPGCGLLCGTACGCYGFERASCCDTWLAGCAMYYTAQFLVGWVVACMVGCRMLEALQ